MTVLFQSQAIVHSNEVEHVLSNVDVESSNAGNIKFEFTKNGDEMFPQEAEYSFATKEFRMLPKEGQLVEGDEIVMKIATRS